MFPPEREAHQTYTPLDDLAGRTTPPRKGG
jgi:hypothetical protein